MQPKRTMRVLTVFCLITGSLLALCALMPPVVVQGYASSEIHQGKNIYVFTDPNQVYPSHVKLTLSPPATPVSTPEAPEETISPSTDPDDEIIRILQVLQSKPWIPLGILLIVLLSALTLILITGQQGKNKVPDKVGEGKTAPLLTTPEVMQEKAYLQLKSQPEITFPLALNDIQIGRASDNTLVITADIPGAETVSAYHARIHRIGRWVLEDLDSTNGVYVNGVRTGRNYLRDGWEIGIGGVSFIFHSGKAES
jgi:hypothetical protein